jgi:hypothetical protein
VTFTYWDGEFYHFVDTVTLDPDDPGEFFFPIETLGNVCPLQSPPMLAAWLSVPG